jgi:hypothetical protein
VRSFSASAEHEVPVAALVIAAAGPLLPVLNRAIEVPDGQVGVERPADVIVVEGEAQRQPGALARPEAQLGANCAVAVHV